MKSIDRLLPAASVVVLLAAGVAHGVLTSYWVNNAGMQTASEFIGKLPNSFGAWTGEPYELSREEIRQTGTKASYTVRLSSPEVRTPASIMLLCGQTRPLSVHQPTVCFLGQGLEISRTPESVVVPEAKVESKPGAAAPKEDAKLGQFMTADFRPGAGSNNSPVRVYWAWSTDGVNWRAPDGTTTDIRISPIFVQDLRDPRFERFRSRAEREQEKGRCREKRDRG